MKWNEGFVSKFMLHRNCAMFTFILTCIGFLMNELQKAKIEPRPAGAVKAPDPSELIDLEVQ